MENIFLYAMVYNNNNMLLIFYCMNNIVVCLVFDKNYDIVQQNACLPFKCENQWVFYRLIMSHSVLLYEYLYLNRSQNK